MWNTACAQIERAKGVLKLNTIIHKMKTKKNGGLDIGGRNYIK